MNAITAIVGENKPEVRNKTDLIDNKTDFLLAALRGAILRAKLDINELTSIGLALRSEMISAPQAMEWLQDAGLIGQVFAEAA